jgi:Subtilase family
MSERLVAVTYQASRAAELDALAVHARGRMISFHSFPVVAFSCRDDALSEIRSLDFVRYVQTPKYASYVRILETLDSWAQLPDQALPQIGLIQNVSISYGPGLYVDTEPMNVATKTAAARGFVLVFAVGNDGPDENTLSPWSVAPWVIGVGASDEHGQRLWHRSSIGVEGDPILRPTVVAWGEHVPVVANLSRDPRYEHGAQVALVAMGYTPKLGEKVAHISGTSLAAPQVARICGYLLTFLEQLQYIDFAHRSNTVEPAVDWPIFAFLTELARRRVPYSVNHSPSVIRTMLEALAQPLQGYRPHEVGAGFVDERLAEMYLKDFSSRSFMQLFVISDVDNRDVAELDGEFGPLIPADAIDQTLERVRKDRGFWSYPVVYERHPESLVQGDAATSL